MSAKRKVVEFKPKAYADKVKQKAYDIYMEEREPVLGRIADKVGVTLEEVRGWWLEDKWHHHKTAKQYSIRELITEKDAEVYKRYASASELFLERIVKRLENTTDPEAINRLAGPLKLSYELYKDASTMLKKQPNYKGD